MIEKINKIKEFGTKNLIIVTDFDDTITKGLKENGLRGSNSFSVFANNPELLGQNYQKQTNELFEKYYKIEQDYSLNNKEKEEHMINWWKKEFELYKKYNFSKSVIDKIVNENLMELKTGVNKFFKLTKIKDIKTIIFSAGIYNLIHRFLQKENIDFKNISVIANQFEFDESGKFIKTTGDIIHSLNKTFKELTKIQNIENKKTCILIGDGISDTSMIDEKYFETVLKIGFLNVDNKKSDYQKRLENHKKYYDIVLSGYDDFSKINEIIKKI